METILRNIHPEALAWIEAFSKNLVESDDGVFLANDLSMMQVISPEDFDPNRTDNSVLFWCDLHQNLYNSVIWLRLIQSGRLEIVRAAFEADLLVSRTFPQDEQVFGNIVSHEYGKAVLENFLTLKPNPLWVRREILKLAR